MVTGNTAGGQEGGGQEGEHWIDSADLGVQPLPWDPRREEKRNSQSLNFLIY